MKTAIPWMLLAASTLFNAFFLAGMFAPPHRGERPSRDPKKRVEMISGELGLDSRQREEFLALETKFHEERISRGHAEAQALDRVIAELGRETPDEGVIKAFLETGPADSPKHHLVGHLRSVMEILKPAQREKAAELFRRGFCRGRGPGPEGPCGPGRDGPGRPDRMKHGDFSPPHRGD